MTANWKTRTIWTGDNLPIMRGMNSESVDLIYLDPPFNSNKNYEAPIGSQAAGAAFKDTWTLNDLDEAWHGELAEQEPPLHAIIDAAGIAHGKGMKSYLIMMGVRLLEMRRVLKPTGSIYLHCDPTASHYLKMLMDTVFGPKGFRNEIVWKRSLPKGLASTRLASNHDILLAYGGHSAKGTWNPIYVENQKALEQYTKIEPETGRRYQLTSLLNPNRDRPNLTYEFRGVTRVWRWTRDRMEQADRDGLIVVPRSGRGIPRLKRYLDEQKGVPVSDTWIDISFASRNERTGYPTQKPLALLDRIIQSSTNPRDIVLDPFCGCATACIAAEKLERHWAGIDLSPKAADLVIQRAEREIGGLFKLNHREDIPRRSDQGPIPHYRTQKHTLFGRQEGYCNGCRIPFPFRNFTIDHVTPRSQGGTDHLENLQLLCGACNSTKGDRDQAYLLATLKRQNQRIAQTEAA